jgi:hypothetical protein
MKTKLDIRGVRGDLKDWSITKELALDKRE